MREMVQTADLCLAIGTRLRESDVKQHGLALPRLIHVDWDDRWIGKNYETEIALTGHVPGIVKGLLKGLEGHPAAEDRLNSVRDMRSGSGKMNSVRSARRGSNWSISIKSATACPGKASSASTTHNSDTGPSISIPLSSPEA